MGFHDNGREIARMKEAQLEAGELPVRLNLLAQEDEIAQQQQEQNRQQRGDNVVRIQDLAAQASARAGEYYQRIDPHVQVARGHASRVLAPVAKVLAPAQKVVAPAVAAIVPLLGVLAPLASMFRPSFLPKQSSGPRKLRKTAYLDGIRGFAALMVYCLHNQLWAHAFYDGSPALENTFGYDHKYYFAALPFIRTFFSGGHFSVSCFLVLSGYVLSVKPLQLMRQGEFVLLGDNVAASLFKRWLRLYLPIIVVSFMIMCTPHFFGLHMSFEPQKSWRDEVWKWYCDCKNMFFIFDTGNRVINDYHPHIWTIPVEFKGSILIYTTCMAISRMTRDGRLWCLAGLWYYMMYIVDGSYFAMFLGGMMICDLEMRAAEGTLPRWMKSLEPFKTKIFYTLFTVSILLGGIPSHSIDVNLLKKSPGWYYLAYLKPQAVFDFRWFYLFWAATFLVASVPHIPWAKRFFETPFCQHLGRISFMLYLMHGPVLWALGDRLYAAVGWTIPGHHILLMPWWVNRFPLPKWGVKGLELSFVLCQVILLPLTMWVAEIMTIVVDDSAIKFTAWLYSKFLPEKPSLKATTSQAEEKTNS